MKRGSKLRSNFEKNVSERLTLKVLSLKLSLAFPTNSETQEMMSRFGTTMNLVGRYFWM
jgi:hypothetical protein